MKHPSSTRRTSSMLPWLLAGALVGMLGTLAPTASALDRVHPWRAASRPSGIGSVPSAAMRQVSVMQDRTERISARLQAVTRTTVRVSVDPLGAAGGGGVSSTDGIALDPDVVGRMTDPGLAGLIAHELGHQVMRHAQPATPSQAAWAREWGERDCDRFAGWLLAATGYSEQAIDDVAPFLYEWGSVVTGHADRVERLQLYRQGFSAYRSRHVTTLPKVLEWLPSSPSAASFALETAAAAQPLEAGGPGERRRAVSPWLFPVRPAPVARPVPAPRTPFPRAIFPTPPPAPIRGRNTAGPIQTGLH